MITWRIREIHEEDHGCEGMAPHAVLMDELLLENETGEIRWIRIPDEALQANGWKEGDWIPPQFL